jgi:hypothetical protein
MRSVPRDHPKTANVFARSYPASNKDRAPLVTPAQGLSPTGSETGVQESRGASGFPLSRE